MCSHARTHMHTCSLCSMHTHGSKPMCIHTCTPMNTHTCTRSLAQLLRALGHSTALPTPRPHAHRSMWPAGLTYQMHACHTAHPWVPQRHTRAPSKRQAHSCQSETTVRTLGCHHQGQPVAWGRAGWPGRQGQEADRIRPTQPDPEASAAHEFSEAPTVQMETTGGPGGPALNHPPAQWRAGAPA